jgi:hypothetical protein
LRGEWAESLIHFNQALKYKPEDGPCQHLIQIINKLLSEKKAMRNWNKYSVII